MDDMSGFSNIDQYLLDMERDLLSKCDKLVVSSQYLFDKYSHYKEPVLIRNAADIEHFVGSSNDVNRPEFLNKIKETAGVIRAGYVGAIEEWFDTDLLKEIAESDISLEFHLCGAVSVSGPDRLEEIENIHMYGEISYSDVPGFINEMDVMIIPFKITPIIQACDPVKFYEYSAMRKPTVTTALPELHRARDFTFVATNSEEFRQQIHNAYEANKSIAFQEKLRDYAIENTWSSRVLDYEKTLVEMPKVSIVILGYGDHELTKQSVRSLYNGGASYPNMEIILAYDVNCFYS
jgi:glycosyltransferase involved in cell wall biosynthesis